MSLSILTDIEGTTSSISFVKNVLFPYAADKLSAFVRLHDNNEFIKEILASTAQEAGIENDVEAVITQLLTWIAEDKKVTPLKALQGLIWQEGYRKGHYQAHVYKDAHQQLTLWKAQGHDLNVYSSGSVKAQHLFFEYSVFGDMRPLFSNYFDTTSGPKKESSSYKKIAAQLQRSPDSILFLSDIKEELDAAQFAGFKTTWLVRTEDGQVPLEVAQQSSHPVATDFNNISF